MRLLNKTLGIFGVLSFFCLGVLSVSFAMQVPSSYGQLQYEKFHGSFNDRLPQADEKTLKAGIFFEDESELNKLPHGHLPAGNAWQPSFATGPTISSRPTALASKVSTCILQSVLNL